MQAFGFSLNTLSLFGLVLAIGIVVDDAIVVVENVERNLHEGMAPREAARHTMDEVGGASAIALVLSAVFVPTAFIPGISGQFYRQFALTIASATIISCLVSLTLSPALAALLLRPRAEGSLSRAGRIFARFFTWFNTAFDRTSDFYGRGVRRLVRVSGLVLAVYGGLILSDRRAVLARPRRLHPGAGSGGTSSPLYSCRRDRHWRAPMRWWGGPLRISSAFRGVEHIATFSGFDAATSTNASNAAALFFTLTPFDEREARGVEAETVVRAAQTRLSAIAEANIIVIAPPAVRGISRTGGFKFMVQDQSAQGLHRRCATPPSR